MDHKICSAIVLPITPPSVKLHDQELFFWSDVAPPHIRPQVVEPPEAAALAGTLQACEKKKNKKMRVLYCIKTREFWI